ncbi:hypothetical protein [Nocardioides sp. GY 10127]|uniref:hypothetical protein n=1 Tax=Nocardioides sp. GY 10127 TaxID=2569762 RepID=UPI0010A81039|nr:hypothetical protein [Nocardioides sp. GY 10127]TIC82529.1 hypothetical protein E8D37_07320 [Nocardioides sp. GY 10127]
MTQPLGFLPGPTGEDGAPASRPSPGGRRRATPPGTGLPPALPALLGGAGGVGAGAGAEAGASTGAVAAGSADAGRRPTPVELRLVLRGPTGGVDVVVPAGLSLLDVLAARPDLASGLGLDRAALAAAGPTARPVARAMGRGGRSAAPAAAGLVDLAEPLDRLPVRDGDVLVLDVEGTPCPVDDPALAVADAVRGRAVGPTGRAGAPAGAGVVAASCWLLAGVLLPLARATPDGAGLLGGVLGCLVGLLALLVAPRLAGSGSVPAAAVAVTFGPLCLAVGTASVLPRAGTAAVLLASSAVALAAGALGSALLGRRWCLGLVAPACGLAGLSAAAVLTVAGPRPALAATLALTVMVGNLLPWSLAAVAAGSTRAPDADAEPPVGGLVVGGPAAGSVPVGSVVERAGDAATSSAVASLLVLVACAGPLARGPGGAGLLLVSALLLALRARHEMLWLPALAGRATAVVAAPVLVAGLGAPWWGGLGLASAGLLVLARSGGTARADPRPAWAARRDRWADVAESVLLAALPALAVLAAGLGPDLPAVVSDAVNRWRP